jgi:CubicO group peptidase (beta-lactamase class C family)
MTMVEEGLLDLDTPVKRYIPEFTVADPMATRTLTLRHLISMSSGLDNGRYTNFGEGPDALGKYVTHLNTLPQIFEPGKFFGYSNASAIIAGYVAERVAGKPWDLLLKERILTPAGFKNTVTLQEDFVFQRVSAGHTIDGKVIRPWNSIGRAQIPSGGGNFAMSAHELARFGQLFINEGVADTGKRIISKNSVKTMMTPHIDLPTRKYGHSWCLGPAQADWDATSVWGHGGTNSSGGSYFIWVPEYQCVMSVVVNTPAAKGKLLKVIFDDVMQAAVGIRKPAIEIPSSPIALRNVHRFTGTYEALDTSIRVYQESGRLLRESSYKGAVVSTEELIPLGGDRFLVGSVGNVRGVVDTAFFGDDGQGRAMNTLNLVFPLKRIS